MADFFKHRLNYGPGAPRLRGSTYPAAYPGRLAETQSAMPSQETDQPAPFDPSRGQPDIRAVTDWSPPTPQGSIVRAVYDSRPPMSYDFYWSDKFEDGIQQSPPFPVPGGYVLILREVAIQMYPDAQSSGTGLMDQWGGFNITGLGVNIPKLQILVDGVATPFWTSTGFSALSGVPIWEAVFTGINVSMFVPIGENSVFTINIPNYISSGGGANFTTYVQYYGNLLQSTGRPTVQEVGNYDPLPVEIAGGYNV